MIAASVASKTDFCTVKLCTKWLFREFPLLSTNDTLLCKYMGFLKPIHVKSERMRVNAENKSHPFISCKTTVAAYVL